MTWDNIDLLWVTNILQPWKCYTPVEKIQMKAKVTSYGTINDIMATVDRKLIDPQKEMFSQTWLGYFLDVPKINHIGQILHNLASRQVYYIDCDDSDENMHFEVSRICVTLSKLQFTVIIGLKCYRNMSINHSKLGDCIQDKFLLRTPSL